MDSRGLATAITNDWRDKYPGAEGQVQDQAPLCSIGGIHRRINKALSNRSAQAWVAKLGRNWKEVRKAIYKDGPECSDVQDYWQNVFLPRMAGYKARMMEWDDNLQPIMQEFGEEVKPLVFITHGESTFNSNDGRKHIWIHEDKSPLRKKVRGQGLHVSDYVTPVGRLDNGKVCKTLKCGGDIWRDDKLMMEQLTNKAIRAFERAFPGCQALFGFDNAKCHQQYASDALGTGNMNLTLWGKNTLPMRDGWFVAVEKPDEIEKQLIMLPDGRLKGLRIVLQERGLWPTGRRFLTQCSFRGDSPVTTVTILSSPGDTCSR